MKGKILEGEYSCFTQIRRSYNQKIKDVVSVYTVRDGGRTIVFKCINSSLLLPSGEKHCGYRYE